MKLRAGGLSLVVAVLMLAMTGCGITTIQPGYVGIKVNSWGSQRGVSDYPTTTGQVTYNPISTEIVEYPTFVQTVQWTHDLNEGHPTNEEISFSSKEGTAFTADISTSYSLEPAKVPEFYVKFRADKLDTWTHGYLRNMARNTFDSVAGHYTVEQVMGDNGPLLREVRDTMQAELLPYGVHLDQLGFIGRPRPPRDVDNMLSAKVNAQQIALTKQAELVQSQADAAKLVAQAKGEAEAQVTRATGEAQANHARNSAITPALLQMRALDNQHDAINKWDGVMPGMMTGSGGNLLFNVPTNAREK